VSLPGIFCVALPGSAEPMLARGTAESGPTALVDVGMSLDELIAGGPGALERALDAPSGGAIPPGARLKAPVGSQPVWAAGVTFERSRQARIEESGSPDHYERVYIAPRPELFFKASPGTARGPGDPVGIRSDSAWNVPEPELAVVAGPGGQLVAATVGNDVSSRSIEGENPLYLPQAKVYDGSAALGPCLVPWSALPALDTMTIRLSIEQDGSEVFSDSVELAKMRRDPAELVSWLQRASSFPVGVVLLTGTSIVPPTGFTLAAGDRVTIEITGLGALVNTVEVVGGPA